MFRRNTAHRQPSLFGIESQLSPAKAKKLRNSWAGRFYEIVFSKIDEDVFRPLFSEDNGRPNAPVNCLVAAIVLMQYRNWTCEELFDRIDFDLQTRTALGLGDSLDETPFCPATFFNFRNRLLSHYTRTGENLLETVFDRLTSAQLKALGLKADVQRCDSFQAMSNIARYGRVQLLVEMLIRLHRALPEEERERFREVFAPYVKGSSGQYIYGLERSDIPHELEKLGRAYHALHEGLKESCRQLQVFEVFERVYLEHFTVVSDKVEVKPSRELGSGVLQSPDDLDATFRVKRGKEYRGQVVNVTETANPDNPVNLVTDVAVAPNNTDDSRILEERIEKIKEKTPELKELHTDGAYGSAANDAKMEELGITHVVTGVRGRKAKVGIEIDRTGEDAYVVRCPKQTVTAERTRRRYKARFDGKICSECPYSKDCPAGRRKRGDRVYYFDRSTYLANRRARAVEDLPPERQNVRSAAESTVNEFSRAFNRKGKLRVRGAFGTMLYAFGMAIGINFGRIYRHLDSWDRGPQAAVCRQSSAVCGSAAAAPTMRDSVRSVSGRMPDSGADFASISATRSCAGRAGAHPTIRFLPQFRVAA